MGPRSRMNRQREEGRPSVRLKRVSPRHSSSHPLSPQRQGSDELNTGVARLETCVAPGPGNISGCSVQSSRGRIRRLLGPGNISGCSVQSSRGRIRRLPVTVVSASTPQPEEEPTLVVAPSQEEVIPEAPRLARQPEPSLVPCQISRQASRRPPGQRQVRALREVHARNLRSRSSQVAVGASSSSSQDAVSDIVASTGEQASTSRETIIVNPTNSPNRPMANPVGAAVSQWRIQVSSGTTVTTGLRYSQAPTMRMSTGRSVSGRLSNIQNPSRSGPKTRSNGQSNTAAEQNQSNSVTLKATGRRKRERPLTQMLLRAAAKRLPVPCKHATSGCKEIMVPAELDEHASICDFRPYNCPLVSEQCQWIGELDEMVNHLHELHPNIEQQTGPIIKIAVTNITQPAPMRWFNVQTCLGKHFLLMMEKLVRHGHSMFFGTAKILGSREEAKGFECKMAVKHPKKTLSYTTVVRTLRSGQEAVIERDCLALDERSADSFAVDHNLLIEVGISMI